MNDKPRNNTLRVVISTLEKSKVKEGNRGQGLVFQNVLGILVLFRYGEANRLGDSCHWKNSYSPFPLGGGPPGQARPHREAPASVRRHSERRGRGGKSPCYGFKGKEQVSQSKQLSCGLWATGWYPLPGSE